MAVLRDINDSYSSYKKLINFYNLNKSKKFETIGIKLLGWFSANMSAVLGGIFDLLSFNLNNIEVEKIDPEIKKILLKNNFLSYWGFKKREDSFHTTIPFLKLNPSDGKFFKSYVIEEFMTRDELPMMSDMVKERMLDAINEIFVNARMHSESKHIYTCGQFYPYRNTLEFTIVDTGIGIKRRVNERFSSNLSSIQAIKWAIEDKNTTKEGISGGIGLAFLKEFVEKNGGKMQIVSDDGYYKYSKWSEDSKIFDNPYPGTIVNMEFKTDDNSSYYLEEEIKPNDIF
jgi:hypothetical protein